MSSDGYTKCPFSYFMFLGTAALVTYNMTQAAQSSSKAAPSSDEEVVAQALAANTVDTSSAALPDCDIVFVVGGPGAGKGTQCQLLEQRIQSTKWKHLSAGDLLRAERKSGGALGQLINQRIAAGKLVPSSITAQLLENAMALEYKANKTTHFLVDGYPRSLENVEAWNPRHKVQFLLALECPEEVLTSRLLERGQSSGRNDDTIDVIRKRFQTFQTESVPIVGYYEKEGVPVHKIATDTGIEQVYAKVSALF